MPSATLKNQPKRLPASVTATLEKQPKQLPDIGNPKHHECDVHRTIEARLQDLQLGLEPQLAEELEHQHCKDDLRNQALAQL